MSADGTKAFNIFLAIDNRPGVQSATGYSQLATAPSTGLETSTGAALTALAQLTLDGPGTPSVHLARSGDVGPEFYSGALRRMFVMNFGSAGLPSNVVTEVMPILHRNSMLPTFELAQAIDRGF
jgi:hypothetical protein